MTDDHGRAIRLAREAAGLCVRCDSPRSATAKTCEPHRLEDARQAREYYQRNRAAIREQMNSEAGLRAKRDAKLRANYGISHDEYDAMLANQNGVCAICQNPETSAHARSGKVKSLAVDHCHESGAVRGLLCHRCNRVLGLLNDDTELIKRLVDYLDDWGFQGTGGN